MAAVRIADAPLGALNTFGIEARARVLWRLEALEDLPGLLAALREDPAAEPLVLGGGSNLLITGDIDRPVIQIALPGRRVLADDGTSVLIEAGAGESWDGLVRWSLAQGAWGLENLALIPGTVGAAPIQNIGAYGVEQRETFDSLDATDLLTGTASTRRTARSAIATASSSTPARRAGW